MTKVLAVDFGTKRVGLAISMGTLAVPLKVIPNDESLCSEMEKVLREENVQKVVVGLSEGEMAHKTEEFVKHFCPLFEQIEFEFFDETLSSNEVEKRLNQAGIKKATRSGPIDHFAAALILENWIEQTGFKG
ncbi:MAG: Holliday junction resolvase RuvX [Candidatus Pacebacteria bacterium CG10_big_fil_rev_8_21_14_0_10_36_11]|nr:Holliday junction resolvase RuvX [Candidatus Pacearchaeota archaeon]OIP73712.1 MAG: hypothetical protein AUK08_04080 [Candidatus Pacebacteria bacterium CG2_30_36_39]PIR64703.1 MAG: Holliday junction resolvase RuvX [Candidatus Pacebacteria bacterium CG10_big_fil_rev_8_21_14_0_10_36_11]PJC42879.1 MAG: Holliday junction resolvase RuvX [Candidatus Pacebacteria bacterium CG_4_9_14_0_2_um_filter_36_8]